MKQNRLVWDLPTRLFHWLLVASLFVQWLTAEVLDNAMQWHAYAGYFTLGLILFRMVWGFIGTRYAKFSNFLASPARIHKYAKSLYSGAPDSFTGHNPLGGLIVPAVLFIVGLQAVSGLFLSDDVLFTAPYNGVAAPETEKLMGWLHHRLFNVILVIGGIHVLAIIGYKVFFKKALVKAMLSGKKDVEAGQQITHSKLTIALIVAALIAGAVYWLVGVAPPEVSDDFYY